MHFYFKDNRVLWCDEKLNVVESVNAAGGDRVRLSHVGMRQPFKIDVFENHVYWLTENEGRVNKVDKYGRGTKIELIQGLDLVEDLKVFHALKVPADTRNPCAGASCSHLCLIKPNSEFECACPLNSNLLEGDLFSCDAGKFWFI